MTNRTTGTPPWSVIAHDTDRLRQAVHELDTGRSLSSGQELTHELLRTVTLIGDRLTALLDALAKRHENPGVPEQGTAHIALDQAAAAAADLGYCARRAARTLDEDF
ncbi:hypothetical protein SAMN04487905_11399 [Actinopolyspora xinjiangensis]|uniref:Uncharacterized protein n=1 Tax=Actinopolyspora xinjiangensis TaxID=405564 RepID=A0A1H0WPT5_9ACTN|nr:hypothetical protein [Actinopolyspora xinjiangensis]SDP92286.1 hypothetical protein SAMN04487905_11399 [Actinopolyspora xinjiangensis]